MNLDWPQITFLCLMIFEMGIVIAKHGEKKTGSYARYNIWSSLLSASIVMGILYWGGFFNT